MFGDLTVIGTAMEVAGRYKLHPDTPFFVAVGIFVVFLIILILIPRLRKNKINPVRRIITTLIAIGCLSVACIWSFQDGLLYNYIFGLSWNYNENVNDEGYLAYFFSNMHATSGVKVEGYSPKVAREAVKEVLDSPDNIMKDYKDGVRYPTILVIQNETFADLSVLADIKTDKPVMPYIKSLKKNTIKGYVNMSVTGGPTANTEFEFLTRSSMAYMPTGSVPYTQYLKQNVPSVVEVLKNQKKPYKTTAFHPYYKENWNRVNTYQYMNFDRYIGMEDITNYQKLRNYISDEWDFQHVIDLYEQRDTSKPFFMFNVTMQNHSPYNTGLLHDVHITSMKGDYPQTEEYLSVIRRSDMALEQLVNYFKNVSEPTIILMYGDHQPFIEDEFYEELYGKSLHELSDAENQRRYITHFFMWANYDIPSGTIPYISANYLSTLLAENANVKLTPYQNFQQNIYQDVPVVSALGCIDKDGNYFVYGDENTHSNRLQTYAQLAYNNLIEEEKRKNELFTLLPTNSK